MKKIAIAFLCGVAFTVPSFLAAAISFPDVNPSDWFFSAVNNTSSWGVILGNEDGSFDPARATNRAEIAVMFDRYEQHLEEKFYTRDELDRILDDLSATGLDSGLQGADDSSSDTDPVANKTPLTTAQVKGLEHIGVFLAESIDISDPLIISVGGLERKLSDMDTSSADTVPVDIILDEEILHTYHFLPEIEDEIIVAFEFADGITIPVHPYGRVGDSFILDASKSFDDGIIRDYSWRQVSGPVATNPSDGKFSPFVPTTTGTYIFELIVTDDAGLQSVPSQIKVIVMP